MNFFARFFSIVTIAVHVVVFLAESVFWLKPLIYERVVEKINAPVGVDYYEQAQILEVLFLNQGFYNLFVALGGIAGFVLYRTGRQQAGITLIGYVCLFALGAGLTLALSAATYIAAMVQGLPPLLALLGLYFGSEWKLYFQSEKK